MEYEGIKAKTFPAVVPNVSLYAAFVAAAPNDTPPVTVPPVADTVITARLAINAGTETFASPVDPVCVKVSLLGLFNPAVNAAIPIVHKSVPVAAPVAQYCAASSSRGDALVVATVATVVLAHSQFTADV